MSELATVGRALAHARKIGVDRLDAQLLLVQQIGCARAWLLAHDDAVLAGTDQEAVGALLTRRAAGEPLAYLIGVREFHGLLLHITPDVLVPRPDTETLVDWALELLADLDTPRVIDLGTGSGAIALALKQACPRARIHASDASPQALAVARGNGQRLVLPITWHLGDWWRPLDPALRFDIAVANPPYIAPGDPHLAALQHEPQAALVAQDDGLADIEHIIAGAPGRLNPSGWLLLEHGFDQADAISKRLLQIGFSVVATRRDLAGQPRVSGGQWGAAMV
ncbi:MAG: peptide chain release factor N(5)-glutamine methyltransferase [Burkholderiaceae bacterium]|nr:peptide chain release factor N(5)-glutamine methyltransferase [Burkholderiaceae bacterium]